MGRQEERVDPETIRGAGVGIRSSVQQLKSDWTAFQAELEGFGEPWGGDDIGFLIGGCYQAVYEVAAECYADNLEAMGEHAEGVHVMAANHFAAEKDSTDQVNRVREILG